jgi:TonB family protein
MADKNEHVNAAVISPDRIEPYNRVPMRDYDRYFFVFILASFLIHFFFVMSVKRVDVSKIKPKTIEEVPQRIARLLMNKPKQPEIKKIKAQGLRKTEAAAEKAPAAEAPAAGRGVGNATGPVTKERRAAQVNVARKASRIEKELRTTGMLALLTGQGPSRYRGRGGAVDILGGQNVKSVDLDAALRGVTGVTRAGSEADLSVKLTTRRVVETNQKVSIADMVQGFGRTEKTLDKLGDIQVSKPKTIGAAPQSANRDENVISAFVKKNMRSIEAEYNRLLKADPALNGKITVRFTILPDGRVTDVDVVESTMDSDALKQKILRVVGNWVFPSIAEGEGNLTVNFPFVFQHN